MTINKKRICEITMNPFSVFEENVRCKILYYACITPHTIAEVNRALGYKSPTFLYQRNSLSLLKREGLLKSIKGSEKKKIIQTNYDSLFDKSLLDETFREINNIIEIDFLTDWESEVTENDLEIKKFRELIINNLSEEKRSQLKKKKFTTEEFNNLVSFWKTSIFRDVIFSLDVISKADKHRLPDNPLNYVIRLMLGFFNRYYMYFDQDRFGLVVPWELSMHIDNIYPAYYEGLELTKENATPKDFQDFKEKQQAAFDLACRKFRPVEDKEEYVDIPTKEIIRITGLKNLKGGEKNGWF